MSRLVGVSCGNKNLIDISSKRQSDFIESRGKFLTLYLCLMIRQIKDEYSLRPESKRGNQWN